MNKPTKEERIKESRERYAERKALQANLKAGRQFFHDKDLTLYNFHILDVVVSYCIVVNEEANRLEIAWCVCSPRDTYSPRVAKAYVGMRLMNNDRQWMYVVPNLKLTRKQVSAAFFSTLILESCKPKSDIPQRLRRAILKDIERGVIEDDFGY